jgi:hypothetical protein
MHRKTDTADFGIPNDDIECWERYPKYRWVYELSRLLDAQSIKWSPYEIDSLPDRELNIDLHSNQTIVHQPGYIYTKRAKGRHILTEMFISKGEIRLMRHIDPNTHKELPSLVGEVELRLNAFATLYFQKFTGVVGVETYSNEIFRLQLRPHVDIIRDTNQEVVKLAKRIYKKVDVTTPKN